MNVQNLLVFKITYILFFTANYKVYAHTAALDLVNICIEVCLCNVHKIVLIIKTG